MGPSDFPAMNTKQATNSGAPLTGSELAEARAWLADCAWRDVGPEEFAQMTAERVSEGIARHYAGGIVAFRVACSSPHLPVGVADPEETAEGKRWPAADFRADWLFAGEAVGPVE
jgi:hypothetical protein